MDKQQSVKHDMVSKNAQITLLLFVVRDTQHDGVMPSVQNCVLFLKRKGVDSAVTTTGLNAWKAPTSNDYRRVFFLLEIRAPQTTAKNSKRQKFLKCRTP